MQYLIKSYLKFIWKSTNSHGVHSPFVFDLVRKCFYDKTNYSEYTILEKYRNSLLANKNTIEVTDFGAGSRVFKSNTRAICDIAKNAGISAKRAQLLFRIVKYFQPKNILEIGTSLGLATSALALPENSTVLTLEGCPETMMQCQLQLQKFNFNNVTCVNTEFSVYFRDLNSNPVPKFRDQGEIPNCKVLNPNSQLPPPNSELPSPNSHLPSPIFHLIYFDGNHSKQATLNYFESLLPTISNETVWIFDDIHWSKDMEEAWEIVKKHPKVTVTIDTFQWGIVFFRSEQVKEDFVVRTEKSFFLDYILDIKTLWGLLH